MQLVVIGSNRLETGTLHITGAQALSDEAMSSLLVFAVIVGMNTDIKVGQKDQVKEEWANSRDC